MERVWLSYTITDQKSFTGTLGGKEHSFCRAVPPTVLRTIEGDKIRLHYTENNMAGHKHLARRAVELMKKIGFKLNLVKEMGGLSVSHQCGTVRFGADPAKSALNEYCRAFDHENLFVMDASFFPSSAAVNPALTIAAQAIRVADHMAKVDFGVK